jgi:hypothetical protein
VAQVQKYAPATSAGRCFYPPASDPDSEQPLTLGQQMLLHGLGWENHEIKYVQFLQVILSGVLQS